MNLDTVIEGAQRREPAAQTELLIAHRDLIAAVAARFVWDRRGLKDVIQNICMRALRGIGGFKGTCRFSTWLYRIAVNECIESNRKTAKARARDTSLDTQCAPFPDPGAPDALQELSDKQLRGDIREAVGKLPLDLKTVFSLFYFGGYSGKEIAEVMHISEANCFMKLKAARDSVRETLRKCGWMDHE